MPLTVVAILNSAWSLAPMAHRTPNWRIFNKRPSNAARAQIIHLVKALFQKN
jgi:hypothetical protein